MFLVFIGGGEIVYKIIFKFRKIVYQTRRSVAILPTMITLLIALCLSVVTCASDIGQPEPSNGIDPKSIEAPSAFKKSYNVVYQFINNHEYLLVPLSGLMAGARICGFWCAAGGGIAGVVDEALVYFGITDKRYLTWGVFGAATGHAISPSQTAELAGVAFGILLPTGMLNDHKETIAPVISALAGKAIDGMPGMISGGAAGMFDETLLNKGIIDNHYLTFATIGEALAKVLGGNSILGSTITNFVGAALGVVAASYEKEIVDGFLAPVETASDLYTAYSKFIPKIQLDAHIEKHATALVGSQFLTQLLSSKSSRYQQDLTNNFEHLNDPGNRAWSGFKSQCLYFAVFLFPYVIGQTVTNSIDDYFEKKLYFALEDKVNSELYFGETALRLSHDKNSTVLMDNLKGDISIIVNSGAGLVANAVSTAIGGAYGVGVIIVSSPNIFIYSALYEKAQAFVAEYLAAQRRTYSEKIRALDSKLISTVKHDAENIRTITERGGIEATRDKIQNISEELREQEGVQKIWSIANNIWWRVSGTANFMFKYYLIGHEINKGKVKFEDRGKIQTASWQLSDLLSWTGRKAMDDSYIKESLDRVIVLEGKIHASAKLLDQINRVTQEGNQLILKDLEVGVGDRVLVTVDELKLDLGKVYAITGESGCGKTSLLSKIKGIKENEVFGKGNIYYPEISGKNPKTVMLSQQDYFPLDASLQEVILYPDKTPTDPIINGQKREEIVLLLKEIGLYAFSSIDTTTKKEDKEVLNLDSKKDWATYLSGGEKKKVIMVSAIIKRPDILILDEIFDGLDSKSIIALQQVLKKYLPNALILVVDHHAQDNNYDAFYDSELHFLNKNIDVREIESKTY